MCGLRVRFTSQLLLFLFFFQLLDSCLASDTAGDGSGCDNMTSIIVLFNSAGKTDQNSKKRKLQSETTDEDSVDKRLKTDDS